MNLNFKVMVQLTRWRLRGLQSETLRTNRATEPLYLESASSAAKTNGKIFVIR